MPILAIVLGVYLLYVGSRGNGAQFVSEVGKSGGFIKWLVAVVIIYWLYRSRVTHDIAVPLIGIAAVAFVLNSLPQLKSQFSEVWNKLGA